ncbi:DUF3352 domain-containing protein [Brunnivagina elsteri]|uniref:DUF3352 domain-containing protein n=1 Tax=Brunnivagina elsteri CCALA 953 TaxID=987040 RepID=A0A2A2TDM1_9CYAN|nr:DUF3352 domain-containing protein [Calothrix elsteri]PAX51509.1 hypothetical protein CK510_24440 [Calothrix elsteri CCALA 953]
MRIFIKAGITTAIGLLICTSAAKAEELKVANQSQASSVKLASKNSRDKSIAKSSQTLALNDAIIFLDKKLNLVANNPKNTLQDRLRQSNQQQTNPITSGSVKDISSLFPADAALVAFINIKPENWENLTRFHLFHMAKQTFLKFMPKEANFNYARDIQSWLGDEVGVVFMPKVGNNPVTMESTFVMVFPVTNDMRVQSFLDEVTKDKEKVKIREYQGVKIFEVKTNTSEIPVTKPLPAPKAAKPVTQPFPEALEKLKSRRENNLAIATFPGYVVLGLDSKPLEQLIDTKNGSRANISANPELQLLTQQHQAPGVLFSMYQNPVAYIALFKDLIKDIAKDLPPESSGILSSSFLNFENINLEQLKAYKSINSSLRSQPEGMRFQVQTYLAKLTPEEKLKSANKSSKNKREEAIIARMPAATYSAITGSNINLYWQALSRGLETIPEVKKGLTGFREFVKTTTSLDFDKDFIGWMDKEYGFFTFPTKGGLFKFFSPNANFGIGFIIKTSNRSAAENTLTKLEQLIKSVSKGEVIVNNTNMKGQNVTSWDVKAGDFSYMKGQNITSLGVKADNFSPFAYSWIEQDTLLVTTGFGAISDLVPKPYVQLSDTYNFTTATNSLPYPNKGYFYVNMGSSLSLIYSFIPQVYQQNEFVKVFKEAIGSIYSISATTSQTEETQQADMLMVLAPTRK